MDVEDPSDNALLESQFIALTAIDEFLKFSSQFLIPDTVRDVQEEYATSSLNMGATKMIARTVQYHSHMRVIDTTPLLVFL
jgi:isochorismate hydrolase